jgi:hypothetical protein
MKKTAIIIMSFLFLSVGFTSCRDTNKEEEMTQEEAIIEEMKEDGADIKVKTDDDETKIKMETENKEVKIKTEEGESKMKVKTENDDA